ncbi:MAG: hypothetical protein ACREXR_16865, partial [Gammaproteobacteria bacterium]
MLKRSQYFSRHIGESRGQGRVRERQRQLAGSEAGPKAALLIHMDFNVIIPRSARTSDYKSGGAYRPISLRLGCLNDTGALGLGKRFAVVSPKGAPSVSGTPRRSL